MTEEQQHASPHSDHAAHTASPEPHPIKMNLWQRWMAWSGSFLVLSILIHVVVLGLATVLVVQVVQGRKEKMKFTAPPPSSAGPAEHKVKPSKRTAAAAPAVSKRITSTAANASIALPAMNMSSSTGPDVMASVMSGMGSAGLGSGAGGGAGGMASMPLTGLTAFGFKGGSGALKGYFYDLKQTAAKLPTGMKRSDDAAHLKVVTDFVDAGWDDAVLDKFYKAKDYMSAVQIYIPTMPATEAPKAFGVEKEVQPGHWIIHYKGTVVAPRDGRFYFVGYADDLIMVRFDGVNVLSAGTMGRTPGTFLSEKYKTDHEAMRQQAPNGPKCGRTFEVKQGKAYPIDIIISEMPGGNFNACLLIAEDKHESHYKKSTSRNMLAYPLFQVKKGLPLPECKSGALEIDPEPIIFQAR